MRPFFIFGTLMTLIVMIYADRITRTAGYYNFNTLLVNIYALTLNAFLPPGKL